MEVKKKLQEKTGTTILTTAFALILGVLFLLLISEYLFLYGTVHRLTDQMQQTVIKTATNNYYNVYVGIREGNSSAQVANQDGVFQADFPSTAPRIQLKEEELEQSLLVLLEKGYVISLEEENTYQFTPYHPAIIRK